MSSLNTSSITVLYLNLRLVDSVCMSGESIPDNTTRERILIQTFDIFAGRYGDANVRWIESVEGLDAAHKRMNKIAAKEHGRYFVFDVFSNKVLASVDTATLKSHAAKSV